MLRYLIFYFLFIVPFVVFAKTVKLEALRMPPGFHVEIYAKNLQSPREMALGDKGTVFVGSTKNKVYAIRPSQNGEVPQVRVIASGLNQPQGVAFYKGNLYVAEVDRIIRYDDIEKNLGHLPSPVLITDKLGKKETSQSEQSQRHAWKTINFGPDGKLYMAIGMPCDSCLPEDPLEGTIVSMNPDGSNMEVYAKGIRNSVGFDWHPLTHELWFTDNGRDYLGDDMPPDKLCRASRKGLDFGFPYYLGIDEKGNPIPDPHYGKMRSPEGITWEALNLPAHVAVLNMIFYKGDMFPKEYKNQIFMAEHGSWNRSKKVGYQIEVVKLKDNQPISRAPFITGWEKNEKYWGRPVGLLEMPDGSLLISDDDAGLVYRVSYHD